MWPHFLLWLLAEMPAPAYVIRDVTQILTTQAELMPAGETTEEHKKWQEEEKQKVELDRSGQRGLFKGIFRRQRIGPFIRDEQDGVARCPRCTWELEDGACGSCGWGAVTDTDESQSMEDAESAHGWPGWPSHEQNLDDAGEVIDVVGVIDLDGPETYPDSEGHFSPAYVIEDEDEEDEGDDGSIGSLDQFIVNDEATDHSPVSEGVQPSSDTEGDTIDTVHTVDSDEDHRSREETEIAFGGHGVPHGSGRYQDDLTDSEPGNFAEWRRQRDDDLFPGWNTSSMPHRLPPSGRLSTLRRARDVWTTLPPAINTVFPIIPRDRDSQDRAIPIQQPLRRPRARRQITSDDDDTWPPPAGTRFPVMVPRDRDSEDRAIPIQQPQRRPRALRQITSDDDDEPPIEIASSVDESRDDSSGSTTVGRHSPHQSQPSGTGASSARTGASIQGEAREAKRRRQKSERRRREQSTSS
ncbi:MAG: hypothetical protein Q9163_000926 [Psora crenata]